MHQTARPRICLPRKPGGPVNSMAGESYYYRLQSNAFFFDSAQHSVITDAHDDSRSQ
jgi:hypothetical protein